MVAVRVGDFNEYLATASCQLPLSIFLYLLTLPSD